MSISGLQPPPPFLSSPRHPDIPWEQWIQAFKNYMVASGAFDLPAIRRKAILLNCLGLEGQRIFQTLTTTDDPCLVPASAAAAQGHRSRRSMSAAVDVYRGGTAKGDAASEWPLIKRPQEHHGGPSRCCCPTAITPAASNIKLPLGDCVDSGETPVPLQRRLLDLLRCVGDGCGSRWGRLLAADPAGIGQGPLIGLRCRYRRHSRPNPGIDSGSW
ncbi:hypothetical protein HPB51_018664 [Rhipicephalus microplus]|uniref:Uncharacterized protein n=1 Tax=Rhipicephalus microplus TaxID=6941 RepID=A0A9J6DAP0_RHIMP|nr:hypothetical protein HPB51_018664 [Rhipicephalus microplus]